MKLDIYRKFSNALAVLVVASVAWIVYEVPSGQALLDTDVVKMQTHILLEEMASQGPCERIIWDELKRVWKSS